jgi:hypothetical protein
VSDEQHETGLESHLPEEPSKEAIARHEDALLDHLIGVGKTREQRTRVVEIAREGKVEVILRIRPLTDDENQDCDEKATTYKKVRGALAPVPIRTDRSKYRSHLIVAATVAFCEDTGRTDAEGNKVYVDHEPQWANDKLLRHFNVAGAWEMVDKLLLPGEKDAVIGHINDVSGFQEDLVEQAKN